MTKSPVAITADSPVLPRLFKSRRALIIVAVVAAIGYGAFPLAYICNRSYFWHGLVSGLAEPGQPYNWLFTSLDIVGALLGVLLFSYLYYFGRRTSKLYRATLAFAVAASLSELVTDVAALPRGYDTDALPNIHILFTHPIVIIHGAASLINSVAFIISLGLWVYVARHSKKGSRVRLGLLLLSVVIGSVGAVIGYAYPASSASLQRIFILAYSVWIFGLAAYAIKRLP
jgi:hypothetical protein